VSQFLVQKSVSGLGGTKWHTTDYLAFAVDRLFYVLKHDPTATVRATAVQSLGRILVRLPLGVPPPPAGPRAEQEINTIAQDLAKYAADAKAGKPVTNAQVVDRLRKLEAQRPPTWRSAMQTVRALASSPVVGVAPGPVRDAAEEIGPPLVRDCIVAALREVALGDPVRTELEADESALVRGDAFDVLARVRSPAAIPAARKRLEDPLDPGERDADARAKLCAYLGEVGGADAFEMCIVRLDDVDGDVRYHAYRALMRMTGARVRPSSEAWRSWQEKRPEWQPEEPAAGAPE
jgi:hypothetical protein